MKRILLALTLCLTTAVGVFAQMSDSQVMAFIKSESAAGTSQSQIVTKLMQRGVRVEQIRRIRNQYDAQIRNKGVSDAADGAVSVEVNRMQGNSDGTSAQEVTTARRGTTGEIHTDAAEEHDEVERDVQATQDVQVRLLVRRCLVTMCSTTEWM